MLILRCVEFINVEPLIWFSKVFFFLESFEHTRSSIVAVRASGVSVGLYSTIVGLRLSTVRIGGPSGVLVGLYCSLVGLQYGV